jgi:two-component system, cell cycle response regulator DivK
MSRPILIIEDNEQNLYLTRYILSSHGYASIDARDGPSGIALAETAQPLLILLDIQLPMMDGYAVAEQLRSISALSQTPIVAVTSYAMVGDKERVLASGCDGYIEKPINPDTFMQEILSFLPDSGAAT